MALRLPQPTPVASDYPLSIPYHRAQRAPTALAIFSASHRLRGSLERRICGCGTSFCSVYAIIWRSEFDIGSFHGSVSMRRRQWAPFKARCKAKRRLIANGLANVAAANDHEAELSSAAIFEVAGAETRRTKGNRSEFSKIGRCSLCSKMTDLVSRARSPKLQQRTYAKRALPQPNQHHEDDDHIYCARKITSNFTREGFDQSSQHSVKNCASFNGTIALPKCKALHQPLS